MAETDDHSSHHHHHHQQPPPTMLASMPMLTSSSPSPQMTEAATTQQLQSSFQLVPSTTAPQMAMQSFQAQELQSMQRPAVPPPVAATEAAVEAVTAARQISTYISFNPDQPPPPLVPPSILQTVGSLLVKTPTSTTATAAVAAAASSRIINSSSCSCAHSHSCNSGSECGCNKNGCDPCNICRLELLSFPRDNMRDSYCYLQGCTPIQYRFKFKLHTTADKKYLGSAFLSAILLAKVTKQNGVEMERIIEDGLKGDSYTPFDPKSGECLIKISFQTAGRGAPWIIRFIASTSEPVTSESILKQTDSCGVTGVPGCKGCEMYSVAALNSVQNSIGADPSKQTVTMTELCHYDFPVKTYSKKAKITKILKGTDNVPTEKIAVAPHKITFHTHEFNGASNSSNSGSSSAAGSRNSCADTVMANSSPTNLLRNDNGADADILGPRSDLEPVNNDNNDNVTMIDDQIHLDPEQIQMYQRQQRQQQQRQQPQQQQQQQSHHPQSQPQQINGGDLGEEMEELHSPPHKYLCQIPVTMLNGPGTQGDSGKVLWDSNFEASLNQLFETIASQNGAFPLSRHLTKEDMQFICNACMLPEYSGVQGAQMWISRAAAGVAKIRRLWDAQSPLLIAGFISKDYTQRILAQCQPGTFMLRFSSGDPGELIIAFVLANEAGNTFVEQSYLVQDNEELSETIVVERILENRLFLNGLDIISSTTFTKELYRPRSRYSKLNPIPSMQPPQMTQQ